MEADGRHALYEMSNAYLPVKTPRAPLPTPLITQFFKDFML